MKTYGRVIVVQLAVVIALLGLSAPAQNLFEADNGKINEFVNNDGVLSTNPTLFASGLNAPRGLVFDSAGDLFEADFGGTAINEFVNNDGVLSTNPTLFASGLSGPGGLVFDSAGDLFEADSDSNKINEFINNDGVLSTNPTLFASGLSDPALGLVFDSAGDLFEADFGGNKINEFINNDGVLNTNPTLFASGLNAPTGLAFSPGALTVEKFQAKVNLNPAKSDIDTCSLTANLGLESGFSVTNQPVTVDVGGVQESFTLNAKGRGVTSADTCKLSYTKNSKLWTLTASLKKGSWATAWAQYGVTNADTPKGGLTVTLPVGVTIGGEAFSGGKSLTYKATADKSGSLK